MKQATQTSAYKATLTLLVIAGFTTNNQSVFAQLIPDNTLGAESSTISNNGLKDTVTGGATRGTNLFHSFEKFNVDAGRSVYFANPINIENILTRVTGNNVSNIFGKLGVEGTANLFLINPNGIYFGNGASLDIKGSFTATTADEIKLGNSGLFSAKAPQTSNLLNIQPSALFTNALRNYQAEIKNEGKLAVGDGKTLTLLGDKINISGQLTSKGGTVQVLGKDINLVDNALINVSSPTNAGNIFIGGDFQGKGMIPNAYNTYIGAGVKIKADSLNNGNGGNVVVWADGLTGFYGDISAKGGQFSGNGGFVEVSGKDNLIFRGNVNTSALNGMVGTLLIDPKNITIADGAGTTTTDVNDTQTFYETTLEGLSGNNNLILQATNNITLNKLTDNSLTLASGSGKITFTADSDQDGIGNFQMNTADTIKTNGRDITISGASLTLGNIDTSLVTGGNLVINVNNGGAIPDLQTATFTFQVTEGQSINDVNLRFSARHTFDGDLAVSLISPSGTTLQLFNGVGGSGDNFQDTLLDDSAANNITNGSAPFNGTFQPSGSLSVFNDQNPQGTWQLKVQDQFALDSGILYKAGETAPWGTAIGTQLILQTPVVSGNSGAITLNATNGNINVGSLNADSLTGIGGEINLTAKGNINLNSNLTAINNINVKADNDINLVTQLTLPAGTGKLAFIADADNNGVGNFLMNTGNTINTTGINLEIQGTNLIIGNINTSKSYANGGSVYINAKGDITANQIASDASYGSNLKGGDITLLSGRNVVINGGSNGGRSFGLLSGTDETINGNAGNISVKANGNININPTNQYLVYGAINASVIRRYSNNVGNSGTIQLTSNNGNITVNKGIFTNATSEQGYISGNSGNIILTANQGNVNVTANDAGTLVTRTRSLGTTGNAGKIEINAHEINIEGRNGKGDLDITTQSNRTGIGGDIIFNSQNPLNLTSLTIGTDGLNAKGGSVKINAPDITFNNTSITTKTAGTGQAGNVEITANNGSILFENQSSITANAGLGASGNGGKISIIGKDFQLMGESVIDASTAGIGNAGNIQLNLSDAITLDGANSILSTSAQNSSTGIAGDITLKGRSLTLSNGAIVNSSTASSGNAGNINLNITDSVNIFGTNTKLSTSTSHTGIGGNIEALTNSFRIADSAVLDAKTSGTGAGGNIKITSNTFDVVNGGKLQGTTSAQGNAGKINIITSNQITLDGANSSLTTNAENGSRGNAGDITLQGRSLTLNNGAQISSNTAGTGKAGNIAVTTTEGVTISGANSGIFASTQDSLTTVSNGAVFTENSDAGQLINTAQDFTTISGTFVTSITGSLSNNNDADLYKIYLSGNQKFSATTVGNTTIDTKLFLFDAAGKGIYANDDSQSTYQSTLPANNALTPVSSGIYYLGIASYPNSPYSSGGEIFNTNTIASNTGAGGNQPLTSWSGGNSSGSYTINLTGTAAAIAQTLTQKGGNGGNITLNAASVSVNNNAQIVAKTAGGGNAGTVNIHADTVNFDNGSVVTSVESGATGQGGTLNITGKSLTVSNGSVVNSSTSSSGNAGNVNLNISDNVNISGTNSKLSTSTSSTGIGGNIDILTNSFRVADNAVLDAKTSGTGTGGKIKITSQTVDILNGGKLQGSTSAQGNADTITVIATDKITIDGANTSLTTSAENGSIGQAGDITLKGRSLTLSNGAIVNSSTAGIGNAGNIQLNNTDNITIYGVNTKLSTSTSSGGKGGNITAFTNVFNISDNAVLDAQTSNIGDGGNITINSNTFTANNAKLQGTTTNSGKAGNINLNSPDSVTLNQGILTVQGTTTGASGSITVNTKKLSLDNTSEISASTNSGTGENINLQNLETLTIDNNSNISTTTNTGKAGSININKNQNTVNSVVITNNSSLSAAAKVNNGEAGSLTINSKQLNLDNNSQISASNISGTIGGDINLENLDNLTINNSEISASTQDGKAGNINITANKLVQINGKKGISVAATGQGLAGNITINTPELNIANGAIVSASNVNGIGGNINVTANTFTANNGGQILTTTSGSAKAGNIIMKVKDNITLDGTNTGLFANTQIGSIGDSGSIDIDPEIFIIRNGAGIGVNSQGSGKGGNISIQAGTLTLDNKAFITAETISNEGGEITLNINDILWMRHGSNITATAGTAGAGGNGGNITINTPFIIGFASENSDITANAFQGNGGNINITTNTIFGLKFRPQLTPLSDITASSQFGLSGQVTINRLDVDPSRGLVSLPSDLVDASNQLAQGCSAGKVARQQNRFSIIGKGGLPSNPDDLFTGTSPLVDLADIQTTKISQEKVKPVVINNQNNQKINLKKREIQQAQGWVISDDGKVILTAEIQKATPQNSRLNNPGCEVFSQ